LIFVASLRRRVSKRLSGTTKAHNEQVAIMFKILRVIILVVSMLFLTLPAYAEEVSKEQLKGLDEQVQEIKSDVLGIAAELKKLIYPSNTQVAVFVSLADGEKFRLDSLEIVLGGKPAAQHLYTFQELEALRKGGVQRIYTGNITTGDHEMQVTLIGQSEGGSDFRRTQSFTVSKDVGPKTVEVTLAGQGITMKDW
jgi:hypothetical protein